MNNIIHILRKHSLLQPNHIAIQTTTQNLSYQELFQQMALIGKWINALKAPLFGLLSDNRPEWILFDLAIMQQEKSIIPLPTFFSEQQLSHIIETANIPLILVQKSYLSKIKRLKSLIKRDVTTPFREYILVYTKFHNAARELYPYTNTKITFTSGSTGQPKGVILPQTTLALVGGGILERVSTPIDYHLCVLPLSTLLENVAGVYCTLMLGKTVLLPTATEIGFDNLKQLNLRSFASCLNYFQANSIILVPELLRALVELKLANQINTQTLRLIAVGGAVVSQQILERAANLKLPVYEGYGLSECGSVISLNSENEYKQGTSGRPLQHVAFHFKTDNELVIRTPTLLHYLGKSLPVLEVETGDIACLENGFLKILGRKKDMFITSYGKNINPDWIETEIKQHSLFSNAVVVGENKTELIAILDLKDTSTSEKAIKLAIHQINQHLPEYAHIEHWITAKQSFSVENGQLTQGLKPNRNYIAELYSQQLR